MSPAQMLFIGAWLLLIIGIYGLIVARSLLKVMIAIQLMAKGAIMIIVVAGYMRGQLTLSQSMAVTVIAIDTLVAVIGLALVVQIKARYSTLDVDVLLNAEG